MIETKIEFVKPIALFLFAHQDDECGALQIIENEIKKGSEVYCLYFTSGTSNGLSAFRRDKESLNILQKLGVTKSNVEFIGSLKKIPDCRLIDNLDCASTELINWIQKHTGDLKIYLPAWEGGHPDHDALHFLGVVLAYNLDGINIYQFPLYNSYKIKYPLFRTLFPLLKNGEVFQHKISWFNRLRYLSYCLRYPSQWKSWIGLFPPFLFHYLFKGTQNWQKVSIGRIHEAPHDGYLYYEHRKFCNQKHFFKKINEFLCADNPMLSL